MIFIYYLLLSIYIPELLINFNNFFHIFDFLSVLLLPIIIVKYFERVKATLSLL